jgi:hypothetical protein
MIWLLAGVPVMIAGLIVGVHFDDTGLQVGTSLDIALVLFVTRDATLPLLERTMMFSRRKKSPKPTVLLSVVDSKDPKRIGLLEVDRNPNLFHENDRLNILSIASCRSADKIEIAKVFINGGEAAGTVIVRNGNFRKGQNLRVESIDVSR